MSCEDEGRLEQAELFELELDLLRWVKRAVAELVPPVMVKPAGQVSRIPPGDARYIPALPCMN